MRAGPLAWALGFQHFQTEPHPHRRAPRRRRPFRRPPRPASHPQPAPEYPERAALRDTSVRRPREEGPRPAAPKPPQAPAALVATWRGQGVAPTPNPAARRRQPKPRLRATRPLPPAATTPAARGLYSQARKAMGGGAQWIGTGVVTRLAAGASAGSVRGRQRGAARPHARGRVRGGPYMQRSRRVMQRLQEGCVTDIAERSGAVALPGEGGAGARVPARARPVRARRVWRQRLRSRSAAAARSARPARGSRPPTPRSPPRRRAARPATARPRRARG
jgi:hypothetical protein